MKRVLATLLLIALLVVCGALASCGGGEAHVHTFKDTWSKDVSGHWYDATCECTDAPKTVLAHTDANNDGACDVCTYTDHTHTYSEDWTADCTNHWNAADCGHIVAGTNIAPHADETADGVCDVCGYVIENLHNHYYSTEWTGDGEYHWHQALCEHGVEVADKAAHVINDAGYCTVCDAKVNEIDKADILAILKAAVANNYKVVTGNVELEQIVYDGSETNDTLVVRDKAFDGVYFVLGNGQSYFFQKDYNRNGTLIGGEQQWYEQLGEDNIFGVKMDVNAYTLDKIMGDPAKLNGYTYMPGSILAAGYDDTTTLAQTIYNFYDLMSKGENVTDAVSNYDAETGRYSFSFTYFTVNELTTGGEVYDNQYALYETEISFTVNDDFVIDVADIQVKVYNYYDQGRQENDLVYDKETNTMSKTNSANPSYYIYNVYQTSGERTFTTPYPKASLLPQGFNFYYVTNYDFPNAYEFVIREEELVGDTIEIPAGTYAYFHIGDPYPATSSLNFIESSDVKFSFVNNNPDMAGLAWYDSDTTINGYVSFSNCLKIKLRDPGTYTVTIEFGNLVKEFTLVIPGEETPAVAPDTDERLNVLITDTYNYSHDYKEYVANLGEGHYTFTVPAGMGMAVEGEDSYRVDLIEQATGGTTVIDLEAGEKVKIYFAAAKKGVYAVDVAYEAADIEDDEIVDPDVPSVVGDLTGTYKATSGSNTGTLVIDDENKTIVFSYGKYTFEYTFTVENGKIVLSNASGVISEEMAMYVGKLELNQEGKPGKFYYNGYTFSLTLAQEGGDDDTDDGLEGSGTDSDPYVITEGDYVAKYDGHNRLYYVFTAVNGGYVTVSSTFDGPWIDLGSVSNQGAANSLSTYLPAGASIVIQMGSWEDAANDVPFTVSFEAKTSDDFSALVGVWSAKSETMWGASVKYVLTINSDGRGTLVYNEGFGEVNATVDYVLVEGTKLTVGYTSIQGSNSLVCEILDDALVCEAGVSNEEFTFTPGTGAVEEPELDPDYEAVIQEGDNIVWISADEMAAETADRTLVITADGAYSISAGSLYITAITNENGETIEKNADYIYELVAGNYTVTFGSLSTFGASADTPLELVVTNNSSSDGEEDVDTAAVVGTYTNVNGYNITIFENTFEENAGAYLAYVYNNSYTVELYFTVVAEANGDGSYTLSLEYVSRPDYEYGTENVDAILAETFIVVPGEEGGSDDEDENKTPVDALVNTYIDNGLNGYHVGFVYDSDAGVYYLNVYGGTQDLYYTAVPTENADGSVSLALTLCTDHWSYSDVATDEYELDGETVVATPNGGTWTFAIAGGDGEDTNEGAGTYESPFVITENGDYKASYNGDYMYPYFMYEATEAGYVTITIKNSNPYFQYGTNIDNLTNNEGPNGPLSTMKFYVRAGQTAYFAVGNGILEEAAEVEFTVTFEKFESESTGFLTGRWEGVQQTMWSTVPYVVVINADGKGSVSFEEFNNTTIYTIDYILVDGNNVTIYASCDFGYYVDEKIYNLVYDETENMLTGDIKLVSGTFIRLDNYEIKPNDDKEMVYIAKEDIILGLKVGQKVGTGAVMVVYTVNGGTSQIATIGQKAEVSLSVGDVLKVNLSAGSGTYSTLTVERVYPLGSQQNPIVIESLPYDMTHAGNEGEKYFKYTATEDIILTITCPEGCVVSGTDASMDDNGNYVVTLKKDETITLNPWANTADTSADSTYTYSITGEVIVNEDGGETTGPDGVYLGSSGRNFQVTIDSAAGTITIIRSDLSGYFTTGGATTYTANYSFDGSTVTYDGSYAMEFDSNGAPTELTWGTQTVTNFVKQ